ncbi:MAG: hypothetical protein QG578_2066 [Thermodesulfobacteriota bacterium]|nr:hypothetical protein [Thermodesulfobacteriota bacterium]
MIEKRAQGKKANNIRRRTINDLRSDDQWIIGHDPDSTDKLMMESEPKASSGTKPFLELTRKKAIGWFILILIVCSWMFVLGILVGRGTAPVQFDVDKLKKDLVNELKAAVEKEKEEKKAADAIVSSDPASPDGNKPLGFYEDLKSTKESQEHINMGAAPKHESLPVSVPQKELPVKEVPVKEIQAKEIAKETAKETKVKEIQEKAPKIGKVNEKTAVPAETKQLKAQKTASPETAVKDTIYTIQVAAVKDMNSAEKLMSDLVKKGDQAYISSGEVPGKGTWYRVRRGGFSERSEAEIILSSLVKDKIKGIIMKK